MIAHAERERAGSMARDAEIEEAILRVYGRRPDPAPPPSIIARPIMPRKRQIIAAEIEMWETALAVGNQYLALFRTHHQWSRVTIASLCRLYSIASALVRLATGL